MAKELMLLSDSQTLYGQEIELIKPIDRTLIPSDNVYFKTKHVLVENLFGGQPLKLLVTFYIKILLELNCECFNLQCRV